LIEHHLCDEQIRIYNAYAGAIIHNNLDAAGLQTLLAQLER
jgi:hypothetical protein